MVPGSSILTKSSEPILNAHDGRPCCRGTVDRLPAGGSSTCPYLSPSLRYLGAASGKLTYGPEGLFHFGGTMPCGDKYPGDPSM